MIPYAAIEDFMRHMPDAIMPLVVFAIPIVAILTKHQRKMTELIHGRQNQVNNDQIMQAMLVELQSLRAEVAVLRDQNNQRAIDQDALAARVSPPEVPLNR